MRIGPAEMPGFFLPDIHAPQASLCLRFWDLCSTGELRTGKRAGDHMQARQRANWSIGCGL